MTVLWIPVIAIIGGIGMIIVIVWMGAQTRQRQAQHRADVQMKLIDRFASASEFVDFVKSEDGRVFLGDAPKVARRGYIGGVSWGIILAFLGFAFVGGAIAEHDSDFLIPAFILIGLGVGFFAAALVSMRIAREMEKNDKQ